MLLLGDPEKALELFKLAGRLGHSEALCNVGAQYYNGLGTEQDFEKAFYAYQNAALYVCPKYNYKFTISGK